MSIQISGELRDYLLDTGSLYDAVTADGGMLLYIFSGTAPANPESSATGNTLLCVISNNSLGTALQFETTATDGVLAKLSSGLWTGDCLVTGTAAFYRLAPLTDDHAASTTKRRIQGTVGLAGADLNVTSLTFNSGEEKRIDYYVLGMLTS